ncbi:MAG: hypothetical protein AAFV43_02110 [Planctomycetota bacterium]
MPSEGQTGARLTSGAAVLEFVWRGDRFLHTLSIGDARCEAQADADGIETPVYQEVHQQGDIVFASGLSGDRHWSASVEPIDGGFSFDVACRVKSPAERLGVTYRGERFRVEADPKEPNAPTSISVAGDAQVIAPFAEQATPPVTVRMRYRLLVTA